MSPVCFCRFPEQACQKSGLCNSRYLAGRVSHIFFHIRTHTAAKKRKEKKMKECLITREKVASIVKDLIQSKDLCVTKWIPLKETGGKLWAVVFAWQGGFEKADDNSSEYEYGEYRICGKISFLPVKSVMADYDMDWLMPYSEKTGEVYDTEYSFGDISDADDAAGYWNECWDEFCANEELLASGHISDKAV